MIAYHLRTKSTLDQGLERRDEECKASCLFVEGDDAVFVAAVGDTTHYWRCMSCVTQSQIDLAVKQGKPKEGVAAIATCEDFDGFDRLPPTKQQQVHDKLDGFFSLKRKRTDEDSAIHKANRTISTCLQDLVAEKTEEIRKTLQKKEAEFKRLLANQREEIGKSFLLELARKDDEMDRLVAERDAANARWKKIEACFNLVQQKSVTPIL